MSVSDRKKKQIIEAAIAEFQEKGYAGTSMDRISERAQVSKRTVYNHFESKEVLFHEINQFLVDQVNSALEIPYDNTKPIREMLMELGWAEGALLINPCFMNLARMVMSETIRDPALAADMEARMTLQSDFEAVLRRASEEGRLSVDDPAVAAKQFLGLIKSRGFFPNLYAARVPDRAEIDKIIAESVDMFMAKYGKDASRPRQT
ncbi:TetR/AcrR family transcriptional regulator [uncultured Roseibium sp.]|uniref:TetR/AcrR family transcriptional regulator n=1 Tax=uncultured Roseibium sp. TaxID=1936171 RepID=UPI00262BE057|nr:TetR/AcrR family transcriptional regulator [uncultured Roseibium sp.]